MEDFRKKKVLGLRLSRTGFTLVEIMIVVAIVALLAGLTIPNLLREKIVANEAAAKATLKIISTAAETFAVANGRYPDDETSMLTPAVNPPYYGRSYCGQTLQGYCYNCSFSTAGYTLVAYPETINSGKHTFTITTGATLTP